jgi:hypothetical protein
MYSAYTVSHQTSLKRPREIKTLQYPASSLTTLTRHIFVVLPESHYGANIGNWLKFGHVVSVEPLAIRYNTVILELLPQSHEVRPHFTKIWTYLNAK